MNVKEDRIMEQQRKADPFLTSGKNQMGFYLSFHRVSETPKESDSNWRGEILRILIQISL